MGEQAAARSRRVQAWDEFLQSSRPDVGYKQTSWWADFLVRRGAGHFGVVVRDDELILGGAQVMIERFTPETCFYYVAHGPVLPDDPADAEQLFEAVMAYIDTKRKQEPAVVSHLRLEPRWTHRPGFVRGCTETKDWLEPRNTLCVDLSLSEAVILGQMKPKGRYNIGVARRKGVSVVADSSSQGLADFLRLYGETVARQPMRSHTADYFRDLAETLFPFDRGAILFAEYQGERLAAALMVYCGDTATYKYGGSVLSHRNVMAPYLLHFEAMMGAKARGHRWYDFYGIGPENEPDHRWANFSVFKRKFGGVELGFVPALDTVFDPDAYQAYRNRKKA